ncbi:MAG: family 1 glycosylhydrolase, partial [Cellulomonas sp.]|nr:family 1 glycosylhydrolase [Cellulomonas sp.]
TAAYQIEGAVTADGRGPSIWDTFAHTPGRVVHGDTGDVAVDHYHRWAADVALMAELGLQAYRFSISWPRIQATGQGAANPAGLAFYDRLVDELLAHGIRPIATLYHWDLPQALQDVGGWAARDTAERFAQYAGAAAGALGDRVHLWTTLNEPWCAAYLGYASGEHAPGIQDPAQALAAVHHLNLAHGLGASAIRAAAGASTPVSIALNLQVNRSGPDAADVAAKHRLDLVANEAFLGPLLDGGYPPELLDVTAHLTDWSFLRDGDEALIAQPLDALGVNYYATNLVRARTAGSSVGPTQALGPADPAARPNPNLVCEDVEWVPPAGPVTEMGWNIDPAGLTELLTDLSARYPGLPLMVTENGAAFDDQVAPDGAVHDEDRIAYLREHVAAVRDAQDAGADVRAYLVWSLLDNFEWSLGYDKRFGVVRVDYDTLERTPKDSARWYAGYIAAQQVPPAGTAPTTIQEGTH